MNWFTSLFKPQSSNGRSKALSSTREAFSMPSPVMSPQMDAYGDTPDPESSTSYTYPPQSNGGLYGYLPTSTASRRPTSLLPLHNPTTPSSNLPPYPPLAQTWNRMKNWLANEYPELGDTLNYGILPQDLAELEMQFGFALPQVVRESYLAVDGQEPESSTGCSEGLFFGLHLLPLEDVYEEWRFWREVDNDPTTGGHDRLRNSMQSIPARWIRCEYSNRGWIPLITDKAGNYIGVDVNPDESGSIGQVIVFGRDFDTKVVLFRGEGPAGWARWLASFVDDLENGDGFELDVSGDSEGSEDDIGYQSYFGVGPDTSGNNGQGRNGMRFTGEYRGWPPLEAWADKSLRKWVEAGIVTEVRHALEKDEASANAALGILDLAKSTTDPGTEVAIPVLTETDEQAQDPTETRPDEVGDSSKRPELPTISVTKPPAPRPVLLPTENDILSPRNFDAPSPSDIESGLGSGALDYDYPTPTTTTHLAYSSPTSSNTPAESKQPGVSSMGAAPASPIPKSLHGRSESAVAPLSDITDLLDETGPQVGSVVSIRPVGGDLLTGDAPSTDRADEPKGSGSRTPSSNDSTSTVSASS